MAMEGTKSFDALLWILRKEVMGDGRIIVSFALIVDAFCSLMADG